jgi:hypothetical protein
MRILVTNAQQVTKAALQQTVLKGNTSVAAFAKLQKLNPHIDFDRITPGTVLLLPDDPEVDSAAGFSASGDAFQSLSDDLVRALDVTHSQIKTRLAQNVADSKTLATALKVRTIAAQIAADPELTAQVRAATTRSADVARQGAADQKALDDAKRDMAADLAALRQLLS